MKEYPLTIPSTVPIEEGRDRLMKLGVLNKISGPNKKPSERVNVILWDLTELRYFPVNWMSCED